MLSMVSSMPKQAAYSTAERPDAAVAACLRRTRRRGGAAGMLPWREVPEVAIGRVVCEEVVERCPRGRARRRGRPSPSAIPTSEPAPRLRKPANKQRHHHLRHAAAEIAPSRGRGVGRADDVRGEHHRRVELRDDEGRADRADRQPEEQEASCSRARSRRHHGNRAEDQQPGVGAARSDRGRTASR